MRISKIRKAFENISDAVLLTSDVNRQYASGMKSSAGFMLITKKTATLFLDFRYYESALKQQAIGEIQEDIRIVLIEKKRNEYVSEILISENLKTLAVENMRLTAYEFDTLKKGLESFAIIGDNGVIDNVRACKDDEELECIRKAQAITDMAFTHILDYIKPGISERDIAIELEFFMRRNGSEGVAFDTICVSGAKTSLPHGVPGDELVDKGFLTMDFGARYKGYCADMTRTVCLGNPTNEMKRVYNTVLEAQNRAFERIHAGVIGSDVDKAARDYIYENGYNGCFGHSTGHSLGLEIHESPNFSIGCKTEIPDGAVLSVEPGIYLQSEFGVRIEDIVVVRQNGYENLTKSVKDFIIL